MNEKILATVGGKPVTDADVTALLAAMGPGAARYNNPEGRAVLLEEVIARRLFLLDAQKNLFEAEAAFQTQLKRAKESLLTEYAIRKTIERVDVTETEMRAFYDENLDKFEGGETVTASHILVATEEEANAIAEKLASGELTFADAAAAHSSCPSKAQGGMLGAFGRGQMVPEFEEAAFAAEIGVVTAPVKTQFGYHLILVSEKGKEEAVPYSEARESIREKLLTEKQQAAYRSRVNQLKIAYPVDKL